MWWCVVQEDEETDVASSLQEIIFREHQPPAQSAEKNGKAQAREAQLRGAARRTEVRAGGRACAWARAQSTGDSSHIYVHEIECEIVLDPFDFGRCDKDGVRSRPCVFFFFLKASKLCSEMLCLQV